jgi:hypothetical protein
VQAFYFLMRSVDAGVRLAVAAQSVHVVVGFVTTVAGLVYFVVAFRNVYGTTAWGSLWRCAVVVALYFPLLVLTIVAITFPFWREVFFGGVS